MMETPNYIMKTVSADLRITRRRLPHWEVGGSTYMVTFRLKHGPAQGGSFLTARERLVVKDTILHRHEKQWIVHAMTVMPDHVHILATPLEQSPGAWFSLPAMIGGLKQRSAREINRLRGRSGPLWQDESHDHITRNEREFDEAALYILCNAAQRELTADPWEWDGFWCPGKEEPHTQPGQPAAQG